MQPLPSREEVERETVATVAKVLETMSGPETLATLVNLLINVYDFEDGDQLDNNELAVGEWLLDALHARCPDAADRVMARFQRRADRN